MDRATEAGLVVETLHVNELDFDLRREGGYENESALEPDLQRVQEAIGEAAHVVVATPLWWGSTPAVLKGLFDRALLPGWAFRFDEGVAVQVRGLKGRSARVLLTMDAPTWLDAIINRSSGRRQVVNATLRFCGMKPVSTSVFGNVSQSTPAQREAMLAKARLAGTKDGRRLVRMYRAAA